MADGATIDIHDPRTAVRRRFRLALSLSFLPAVFLPSPPSSTAQQAPDTADILVIENTQSLRIYDQYQQSVRNAAKAGLPPFTPMRVVRMHDLLGDGFTPCARVEVRGKPYFLLQDESGNLAGAHSGGSIQLYERVQVLNDTVIIRSEKRFTFRPAIGSSTVQLRAGESVARVFRDRQLTYVRRVEPPHAYGWVDLTSGKEGEEWTFLRPQGVPSDGHPASSIVSRVNEILQETNIALAELFGVLNRQTRRNRPAPRWEMEVDDSGISCILRDHGTGGAFSESTSLLGKQFESLTLGTPLRVSSVPGRIEIR